MMSLWHSRHELPTHLMSHLILGQSLIAMFDLRHQSQSQTTHFVIGHHQNNNTRHTFEGIGSDLTLAYHYRLYRACQPHYKNKRDKLLSKLYEIKTIYTHLKLFQTKFYR